uniref:Uncharacterized protein n=1 Tax=Arundo donax TaxID=35708 RepID=A0A0A9F718_ARUDO
MMKGQKSLLNVICRLQLSIMAICTSLHICSTSVKLICCTLKFQSWTQRTKNG